MRMSRVAVVTMLAAVTEEGITDIGKYLLRVGALLAKAVAQCEEVELRRKEMEKSSDKVQDMV